MFGGSTRGSCSSNTSIHSRRPPQLIRAQHSLRVQAMVMDAADSAVINDAAHVRRVIGVVLNVCMRLKQIPIVLV
jgi:hypothetical protein